MRCASERKKGRRVGVPARRLTDFAVRKLKFRLVASGNIHGFDFRGTSEVAKRRHRRAYGQSNFVVRPQRVDEMTGK